MIGERPNSNANFLSQLTALKTLKYPIISNSNKGKMHVQMH